MVEAQKDWITPAALAGGGVMLVYGAYKLFKTKEEEKKGDIVIGEITVDRYEPNYEGDIVSITLPLTNTTNKPLTIDVRIDIQQGALVGSGSPVPDGTHIQTVTVPAESNLDVEFQHTCVSLSGDATRDIYITIESEVALEIGGDRDQNNIFRVEQTPTSNQFRNLVVDSVTSPVNNGDTATVRISFEYIGPGGTAPLEVQILHVVQHAFDEVFVREQDTIPLESSETEWSPVTYDCEIIIPPSSVINPYESPFDVKYWLAGEESSPLLDQLVVIGTTESEFRYLKVNSVSPEAVGLGDTVTVNISWQYRGPAGNFPLEVQILHIVGGGFDEEFICKYTTLNVQECTDWTTLDINVQVKIAENVAGQDWKGNPVGEGPLDIKFWITNHNDYECHDPLENVLVVTGGTPADPVSLQSVTFGPITGSTLTRFIITAYVNNMGSSIENVGVNLHVYDAVTGENVTGDSIQLSGPVNPGSVQGFSEWWTPPRAGTFKAKAVLVYDGFAIGEMWSGIITVTGQAVVTAEYVEYGWINLSFYDFTPNKTVTATILETGQSEQFPLDSNGHGVGMFYIGYAGGTFTISAIDSQGVSAETAIDVEPSTYRLGLWIANAESVVPGATHWWAKYYVAGEWIGDDIWHGLQSSIAFPPSYGGGVFVIFVLNDNNGQMSAQINTPDVHPDSRWTEWQYDCATGALTQVG